jgi:hypothetical protein
MPAAAGRLEVRVTPQERGLCDASIKRLERGTFRFPAPVGDRLEVTPAEMAAILEGIDLSRARRQRRFVLPTATPA